MGTNVYLWSTTTATNSAADSDINWAEGQAPGTVNDSSRAMMAAVARRLADVNGSLTSGGSANAHTFTTNTAYAALVTGLKLQFKAGFTNTGAATLNVTPLGGAAFGAKAIRVFTVNAAADVALSAGMITAAGQYIVTYDSTANAAAGAWILMNPTAPPVPSAGGLPMINGALAVTAGASALTIALKTGAGTDPSATDPVTFFFRNVTGTTGDYTTISVTAATSLVISSGSTLGVTSSKGFRVWIVGFNDGGTFRLGAVQCAIRTAGAEQILPLGSYGLASSTTEGGIGGADSAGVIYSGTGVTSKAMLILGFAEWNATGLTAGTWTTTNLSLVQLVDPSVKLPGDIVQKISATSSPATSTGSATFVTTSKTLAVVPVSAANLIESYALTNIDTSGAAVGAETQISRGNTANTTMIGSISEIFATAATALVVTVPNYGMDSPNTTSSQTYTVQIRQTGGGTAACDTNKVGIMTLTELQT